MTTKVEKELTELMQRYSQCVIEFAKVEGEPFEDSQFYIANDMELELKQTSTPIKMLVEKLNVFAHADELTMLHYINRVNQHLEDFEEKLENYRKVTEIEKAK